MTPRQRLTVVVVAKHAGVKYLWDIAETRDLVCARTPSEELASACPEGLFDGEETLTLDERSFNLSIIYRWVDRVADVL
jgi:hypothetical protein